MQITTTTRGTVEALSERSSNGISVSLLWNRATNALTVRVHDEAIDHEFVLDIDAGDDPLEVYNHPYAYAAFRGLDLGQIETREPINA